jgi:hypothetical protein
MMGDSFLATEPGFTTSPDFSEKCFVAEQAFSRREVYISWRYSGVGSSGNEEEK